MPQDANAPFEPEEPTWFLLERLLRAREDLRMHTGMDGDDEDVNVYLSGLLAGILRAPDWEERNAAIVRSYEIDMARDLADADRARSFCVLKVNADNILVSLGIFRALPRRSTRYPNLSRDDYVERGRNYYQRAASYRERIDRQTSGRADVLRKLAHGYDRYLKILDHMRDEYLHLRTTLSPGTIFHLEKDASTRAHDAKIQEAIDQLLDVWTAWQRHQASADAVRMAVDQVRSLKPGFQFPAAPPTPGPGGDPGPGPMVQ